MRQGGVGVSPGNVPVYYGGGKLKSLEKKIKVAELVLRFVILGLGLLAAALVASDSQVRVIFSIEKKAKFTDMKALVVLVIANGIASGYSLIQGLRCVVSMVRGSVLFSKGLAWAIFSCDQDRGGPDTIFESIPLPSKSKVAVSAEYGVLALSRNKMYDAWRKNLHGLSVKVMAYVTLAAAAAAAQSAVVGEFGQPQLQWMKICNLYGKFCTQVGEGLASAFIVSLGMVALSCLSAFNLFRLYGSNKGKNTAGGW